MRPVSAVKRKHPQVGGEALRLVTPVGDQAGRAHDESWRGQPAGCLLGQDVGQSLDRLTQAHIVGEDTAEPQLADEAQPGEPVSLIGSQGGTQARRGLGLAQPAEPAQRGGHFHQARCAHPAQP